MPEVLLALTATADRFPQSVLFLPLMRRPQRMAANMLCGSAKGSNWERGWRRRLVSTSSIYPTRDPMSHLTLTESGCRAVGLSGCRAARVTKTMDRAADARTEEGWADWIRSCRGSRSPANRGQGGLRVEGGVEIAEIGQRFEIGAR